MLPCPCNDDSQKTMNIFRQLIETDQIGFFLADALHEDGKIVSIKIFPVVDGILEKDLGYGIDTLAELVGKMQVSLTESLNE